MKRKNSLKAAVTLAALVAVVTTGVLTTSQRAQAGADDSQGNPDEARIKQGFEIAPVPLNLNGKDRNLVGLGSYIVNASASCNDCHDAGPAREYAPGGNPYLGEQKLLNPKVYLGGGQDFGPVVPGSPRIISRNLTPDVSGKPIWIIFTRPVPGRTRQTASRPPSTVIFCRSCRGLPFRN